MSNRQAFHQGTGLFSRIAASLLVLLTVGCQQETEMISPVPPDQAITIDAPVAQLLQRLVMLDGSGDNIVDRSSCSSLVYPVSVTVNGQPLLIQSSEDLDEIERVFDASGSDEDSVVIQFPVTLLLADYSTQIINNLAEWESLLSSCTEGGSDDDLECLDLEYPVSMALYDTANQKSSVVTFTSDRDVFLFLDQVSSQVLMSFRFPVVLTDSSGLEYTVTDFEQLEDILLDNDDCDEDDDNDYDDDDLDTSALEAVLTSGTWLIDSYIDDTNQTSLYAGYSFVFQAGGQATATRNSTVTPGSWQLYGDSGALEWELDFGSEEPLQSLNEDWEVIAFTDQLIQLTDKPGDPEARILTFKKQ